jgi:beta-glucanase (GH16 family)
VANLIFSDTFTAQAGDPRQPDSTKWIKIVNHTMTGMWADVDFIDDPSVIQVQNNRLELQCIQGAPTPGKTYSAGFIRSVKNDFLGGYYEAFCRIPPNCKGMCHAWWMNTPPGVYPEFDILENQGNYTTHHTLHDAQGDHHGYHQTAPTDNDYHEYGLLWLHTGSKKAEFYIDRSLVFTLTDGQTFNGATVNIPTTGMQLMLNSATGNFGWPNNNVVDGTTGFPSRFYVSHVRVWDAKPF